MALKEKKVIVKLAMKMLMISKKPRYPHPQPHSHGKKHYGSGEIYERGGMNGFTLMEILIVIVIISIVASVATLTIHFNQNKQMESLAHQLVNQISLAQEEAMLRPIVLGIAINRNSIQFYSYNEQNSTWQLEKHNYFRVRSIPDNTVIHLKINDKSIPEDGKPHLIISSNGEIPSFIIAIGKPDEEPLYQVIGEENGNVYAK